MKSSYGREPPRSQSVHSLASNPVALKVTDLDSRRMMIRVAGGKGDKDRYTVLSPRLLGELRAYWRVYQPEPWLFPGSIAGRPIADSTARAVFMAAKRRPKEHRLLTKPRAQARAGLLAGAST